MVFKNLVKAILKHRRDPDDWLTHNAYNSLKREITQDLIEAYGLSKPLVDAHPTLFWESNSFFDFLIKICEGPLDILTGKRVPEYFKESKEMYDDLKEKYSKCEREKEDLIQKWHNDKKCEEGQTQFINALEMDRNALMQSLQECERRLKTNLLDKEYMDRLESEKAALEKKLEACQTLLETTKSGEVQNGMAEQREIIKDYTKQLEKAQSEVTKLLKENEALEREHKKLLQDYRKLETERKISGTSLQNEIVDLKQQLEILRSDKLKNENPDEKQLARLLKENQALEQEHKKLLEDYRNLETERKISGTCLQNTIDDLKQQLEILRANPDTQQLAQSEVTRLLKENQALENERKNLLHKNLEREDEIVDLKQQLEILRADNLADYTKQLENAQSEVTRLLKENETLEKEYKKLLQNYRNISGEQEILRADYDKLQNENHALVQVSDQRCQLAERKIGELTENLNEREADHKTAMTNLKQLQDDLKQKLQDYAKNFEISKKQIDQLQNELTLKKRLGEESERRIEQLTETLSERDKQLKDMETSFKLSFGKIPEKKRALESNLERLQDANDTMQQELQDWDKKLTCTTTTYKRSFQNALERKGKVEKEFRRLQKEHKHLQDVKDALREKLGECEKMLEGSEMNSESLKSLRDELTKQTGLVETYIKLEEKCKKEKDECQSELQQAQTEMTVCKKDLQLTESQLKENDDKFHSNLKELMSSKELLEKAKDELEKERQKCFKLQNNVWELEETVKILNKKDLDYTEYVTINNLQKEIENLQWDKKRLQEEIKNLNTGDEFVQNSYADLVVEKAKTKKLIETLEERIRELESPDFDKPENILDLLEWPTIVENLQTNLQSKHSISEDVSALLETQMKQIGFTVQKATNKLFRSIMTGLNRKKKRVDELEKQTDNLIRLTNYMKAIYNMPDNEDLELFTIGILNENQTKLKKIQDQIQKICQVADWITLKEDNFADPIIEALKTPQFEALKKYVFHTYPAENNWIDTWIAKDMYIQNVLSRFKLNDVKDINDQLLELYTIKRYFEPCIRNNEYMYLTNPPKWYEQVFKYFESLKEVSAKMQKVEQLLGGNDVVERIQMRQSQYLDLEWETKYIQWLKDLGLDPNTKNTDFASIVKNKLDEWQDSYKLWLGILNLDQNLEKDQFTLELKKRARNKMHQTREPGDLVRKRPKIEEKDPNELQECVEELQRLREQNWHLQAENIILPPMKTLFHSLFHYYFQLRWQIYVKVLPDRNDLVKDVKEKMELLNSITSQIRPNKLFEVCKNYVDIDMKNLYNKFEEREEFSPSKDKYLDQCVEDVKKFLHSLSEKCNLMEMEDETCN